MQPFLDPALHRVELDSPHVAQVRFALVYSAHAGARLHPSLSNRANLCSPVRIQGSLLPPYQLLKTTFAAVVFFSLVELMFDGVVEMQLTVRNILSPSEQLIA